MGTNNALLELAVTLPENPIKLAEPCIVTVRLINRHDSRLRVNKRMAVGYEKNLSRELFADILDRQTKQKAKVWDIDYHRNFPTSADYVYLQPGEALTTTFNLFEWYMPASPGEYTLVVYYQADEEQPGLPEDIVHGIFSSQPVDFAVASPGVEN